MNTPKFMWATLLMSGLLLARPAFADHAIKGQVQGGGAPIANSTVTLWQASMGEPKKIAQTKTNEDGRFEVHHTDAANDTILYLVAVGGSAKVKQGSGDNPAIVLLSVLESNPPDKVVVNELTTVASAFTAARFINGTSISGNALGLRIAAGDVPNLVDPVTGTWGKVLLDPINSTQTATLATLDTLGSLLTASFTVADDSWRTNFFKAATPTGRATPQNTLEAAAGIAREPWAAPKDLFALFDQAYPHAKDGGERAAPFLPYLALAPPDFCSQPLLRGRRHVCERAVHVRQECEFVERAKLDAGLAVRCTPQHWGWGDQPSHKCLRRMTAQAS